MTFPASSQLTPPSEQLRYYQLWQVSVGELGISLGVDYCGVRSPCGATALSNADEAAAAVMIVRQDDDRWLWMDSAIHVTLLHRTDRVTCQSNIS